ncbi:MAG: vanadium-dependent haloperoxidase [Bacteroidota bacterium]
MTQEEKRRKASFNKRVEAAQQAYDRGYSYRVADPVNGKEQSQPVVHLANDDEAIYRHPMSFTKGLPHDYKTGLIKENADFDQFVKAIDSGDPLEFKRTPLGPNASLNEPSSLTTQKDWKSKRADELLKDVRKKARNNGHASSDIVRAWESESAGLAFDLEAPDAQSITIPPAPALGSDELTSEMAEVYMQAFLRDEPFETLEDNPKFDQAIEALNNLRWFEEKNRYYVDHGAQEVTPQNAFRGIFRGDLVGPYISQFMLIGNTGITGRDEERGVEEGLITYGALSIDQRVRNAKNEDHMNTWDEWFDVQNGADFRSLEEYEDNPGRKFIATPRDLATYVHYDALYEAYLNACIIMLGAGASADPGIPFQQPDRLDHQTGFALYGGPHILTLVTEVATRALKAVRYQKFNVHRRCRPEVLAARMEKLPELKDVLNRSDFDRFERMFNDLDRANIFNLFLGKNKLLAMPFVEGSPMHASYGAGHATVAGACSTILKAYFDHTLNFNYEPFEKGTRLSFSKVRCADKVFVAEASGASLKRTSSSALTIEGELNKVAANVSIGRDWAGVHYYSDYVQSMLLGEEIAIGLLQEQSLTYLPSEGTSMTLPKFDGSIVKIINGQVLPVG